MGHAMQQQILFGPVPSKDQILHFNYSHFQSFLYQTLCVFSQIKDIKHISSRTFILFPGSCPRGHRLWVLGGQKFNFSEHGHMAYQIEGDGE